MRRREESPLTPDQLRAREAVRDLSDPTPSQVFRDRLKRDFLSGRVEDEQRSAFSLPNLRTLGLLPLGAVAFAALLLLAFGVANRGPAWRLDSPGQISIDGVSVRIDQIEASARLLKPGAQIAAVDSGDITLRCQDNLVLQLAPGSEITLPRAPGRWFSREIETNLSRGRLRISTGSRFPGGRLLVTTPEASIEVLGTTLSVICETFGTCVCVFEGTVSAGPIDADSAPVEAGTRRVIFNDGRPPKVGEIRPDEFERLRDLRSF